MTSEQDAIRAYMHGLNRAAAETMGEDPDTICRQCGDADSRRDWLNADGLCPGCAGEDDFVDEEAEDRKAALMLAMERNPDLAFTASDMEDE